MQIFLMVFTLVFLILPCVNAKKFEVPVPIQKPIYLVVKGNYASQSEAKNVQNIIQHGLGNKAGDGIIESRYVEGFPQGRWVVGSFFDSPSKAQWWIEYSYRNPKLPKPLIKKTQLLQASSALPYFPEALHEGKKRFYSEEEVLEKVQALSDVKGLKKKGEVKLKVLSYPRSGDYQYEVEILEAVGKNKYRAHDFVKFSADNLEDYSRFLGDK